MKRPILYLVNVLLTLLLIFSCIGTVGCCLLQFQALRVEHCQKMVESSALPNKVHESLVATFTQQENTSGIPESVYERAISEEQVATVIDHILTNGFAYLHGEADTLHIEPDFTMLEEDLCAFYENYATENGYKQDEVYEKALKASIETAKGHIQTECDIFCFEKLDDAGAFRKLRPYIPYVGYGLTGVIILDILLLIALILCNRKEKALSLYWVGIALLIASTLILIPATWLQATKWFDRFAIKSTQIFTAVCGYLYGLTSSAIMITVCGVILAILLLIGFAILQHNTKKSEQKG